MLAACLLAMLATAAHAETRYITDTLFVPLRSIPNSQGRIVHKGLKSGAAVEVLGRNEDGSYTQVRSGTIDGWLPTQYLVAEPTAGSRLDVAQQQLNNLQEESTKLRSLVRSLEESNKLLGKQAADAEAQARKATEELAEVRKLASNAIQLNENNQALVKDNELLRTELGVVSSEAKRLKENTDQQWFLKGGFTVLLGVVIALLVPRLAPRRRHGEWK